MIFSNEGITQVGGNPINNILELAQILETIQKRMLETGGNKETADKLIVVAGKMSTLPEEKKKEFLNSLAPGGVSIDTFFWRFDEFLEGERQRQSTTHRLKRRGL